MNVLFVTSDLKINNIIIEQFEQKYGKVTIKELDFLEDAPDKLWDFPADIIVLSDTVNTKTTQKKMQRDIMLYQFIKEELSDYEEVYLVVNNDRTIKDRLLKKLSNEGFFNIIPEDNLSLLMNPPKNEDELMALFNGADLQVKTVQRGQEEKQDDFLEPPTKLTDQSLYLPKLEVLTETQGSMSRTQVSAFWSPLPNVGVGSIIRAIGYILARSGRKVLMMELDWDNPKLARQTALTHNDRHLKAAIQGITTENKTIESYIVNNTLAENDLPHTHRAVKARLKELPSTLFALSRNTNLSFENNPQVDDEHFIEKIFYQAKEAGFDHVLVDIPSSPNDMFTMLSLLFADERFAVVDETFTTSGLFKIAMDAFEKIELSEDDFELIINKTREDHTANDISEFYEEMNPVLSLPYDEELLYAQLDLKQEGGMAFMEAIKNFVKRYGVKHFEEEDKSKKRMKLFG